MKLLPTRWLPRSSRGVPFATVVTAAFQGVCGRDPTEVERHRYVGDLERGAPIAVFLAELVGVREAANRPFVPAGHHYSPIPPRGDVERHLAALDLKPHSLPGIALDRGEMIALWSDLVPSMRDAPFAFEARPGLRYRYDNGAFSWGDGLVLHAMLRRVRPRRLIEVGSGWSSACIVDTNERYLDARCEVTCIEPFPELVRQTVGETRSPFRMVASRVQEVPLALFETLAAGDILFIDSTHVLRTGGDVAYELLEILPRLAPGVFVHLHDMFWPFEYPAAWSVAESRAWNEIYAVRAFLCDNPLWRIAMFNDFFAKTEPALIGETCPSFLENPGGGLWLERR